MAKKDFDEKFKVSAVPFSESENSSLRNLVCDRSWFSLEIPELENRASYFAFRTTLLRKTTYQLLGSIFDFAL